MKMIKEIYTEHRILDSGDVRNLCVKRNYYTRGDSRAYDRMFDMVFDYNKNQSMNTLKEIAMDIVVHSSEDCFEDFKTGVDDTIYYYTTLVMGELTRECTYISYKYESVEEK